MAGAGARGAHRRIIDAIRSFGIIVEIDPEEFIGLLDRQENPLVLRAEGGILRKHQRYIVSYKGFAFYTESREDLILPKNVEIVEVGQIKLPNTFY